MVIPGTRSIAVEGSVNCPNNGELFCFCVNNLNTSTYLLDFIKGLDVHLPYFVFSNEVVANQERLISEGMTRKTNLEKAREFLQKTKANRTSDSGELGELLLYIFAKEVKNAHKLVSKIQTRGSERMTIPGRDGIYAWKDEISGDIYMLIGEAKMKPDSNDGLREAQGDINSFWSSGSISHELNLASANIRRELDNDNADIYEAYFIDDNEKHAELKYKNVIFVGYDFSAVSNLIAQNLSVEDFEASVVADLERCFGNQLGIINSCPHESIYCFIPFESIDLARQTFAAYHSLT